MTDPIDFRRCLGRFATGVTVITCIDGAGERCGITVNSFSSVSLEPPLILWNIAKVSRSLDAWLNAGHFGVNVLAADQQPLSAHFARSDIELFRDLDHDTSVRGVPRLRDCLAWLECRTHEVHDCGDHHIIVGEVLEFEPGDGDPLLFYRGEYHSLEDN